MVGATLVVAIALATGAAALTLTLQSTLVGNVDAALRLRAKDIGAILESGALPKSVAIEGDEAAFVQILDSRGHVLTASANIEGEPEITQAIPGHATEVAVSRIAEGRFRVYARSINGPPALTVVVGRSLNDVERTTGAVRGWLILGVPALLILVAATSWVVVGRALHPVDAIRAEVADIGGTGLDRRVPLPRTNDEIGRLASTMNEMLERLESANDTQKRFVSDAAHELRTPLATVRHEIDVARADPAGDLVAVLGDVEHENRRMERLVDDLLLLARHDQVQTSAKAAVARHAVADLDELALIEAHRRRGRPVQFDTAGLTETLVYGDEGQLGRIIRNLVDNAVTHSHSRVRISTSTMESTARLTVEDDGDGVEVGERERIFERFSRADSARSRDAGGTGLGLAIARELAANHGGTIEVQDSPDLGGARFILTLPVV